MSNKSNFRKRLLAGEELIGLFVKTPHHSMIEVLGNTGLDFLTLDQEHTPFDLHALDTCIMAGRACDMPMLVRIQTSTATGMLGSLDCGATGVIVPHVATVEKAQEIADGGRYRTGNRGFAGTQRAGGYGTKAMNEYMDEADIETVVIAQIEDVAGVDNIEEIIKIENIDGIFLGRADLTVGYRANSQNDKIVQDAIKHVCAVAKEAGKPISAYAKTTEIDYLRDFGVTMFAVSSEHNLVQDGVSNLIGKFK